MKLPSSLLKKDVNTNDYIPVYKQFHTFTLTFEEPETSELDENNPFLNYRLLVQFKHTKSAKTIRGFYAADGDAAETSADEGKVWKVRFTPEELGEWNYSATLHYGDSIVLNNDPEKGTSIEITNAKGSFLVTESDKEGNDFRAHGRLEAYKGYYRFRHSGNYWMKGGTNSPENLLAYKDFDGTYRVKASQRAGEASTNNQIHAYSPHLTDWNLGDLTWKNGQGKSLIGAINYLSSKGMNTAYFLTMNVLGDGSYM